jgi:hypothetical protein
VRGERGEKERKKRRSNGGRALELMCGGRPSDKRTVDCQTTGKMIFAGCQIVAWGLFLQFLSVGSTIPCLYRIDLILITTE